MPHATPFRPSLLLAVAALAAAPAFADPPPTAACEADARTLCLLDGRFRVQAAWKNQYAGGIEGMGQAVPLTPKTGVFWFFERDNFEVMIKVLDGRVVNDRFWVFLGSLSDVEYRVVVTDTATGDERVYLNPPGNTYGIADTGAFPGGGVGDFCGGIAGFPCPGDLLCDQDPGTCDFADAGGTCVEVPEACIEIFDPVCGCDGVTYPNDCERLQVGVPKDHDGTCDAPPPG